MTVDVRTRLDGSVEAIDPISFFGATLPAAFEHVAKLLEPTLLYSAPAPLVIKVEGAPWTLSVFEGTVAVERGTHDAYPELRLDVRQLSDLVHDQVTPNGWLTRGDCHQMRACRIC